MKERPRDYTLLWRVFLTKPQLYSRAWCLFGVSILRIDRRRSATSKLLLPILRYRFTPMCRKTARRPASSLPSAGCLWKCLPSGSWWQQPLHAEIGQVSFDGRLSSLCPAYGRPFGFRRGPRPTIAIYFGGGQERSARRSD